MLEEILNAFDPPAFFTTAPLWTVFTLPGAAMGIFTTISALVIMCLVYPYKDADPDYEFRGVLACVIAGIGGALVFVTDIIALVMFWDGALHPALTAHGVNGNSARILSDMIAIITNTAAFAAPIAVCVEIFRALVRREDRRVTRRRYLEARALERATRD
jgi:hypothetical protein